MKLHTHPEEFRELITVVANEKHISESAVERDYYIVMMLKSLADSPYADQCVFKGGTSLSKCYPGSIDRFSEDIDLTFLGMELSDKACDKTIKKIETIMAAGAQTEKIVEERSNRSKSMYVWFGNPENRVKLEIGSTVRPDPYQKMPVKTCIQEFLESRGFTDDIERFELETVEINTLNIERTFIDKIMSVKRHAICGTLNRKVRHIYDVTRLYQMPEIQAFLAETDELKRLVRLTKDTDSYYIGKRNISAEYDPTGAYDFDGWQKYFDADIRITYETLHTTLLYTDEKQDFDVAVNNTYAATEMTLRRFTSRGDATFHFFYDYGDGWEVVLRLEEVFEDSELPGKELPRVLEGQGFGIIEDCGGPAGLEHLREVFQQKSSPEYQSMREWLGTSEVDLSVFDLQDLNFRLKKLPRIFRDLYEYDYPPTKHSIDLLDRKYCKTN